MALRRRGQDRDAGAAPRLAIHTAALRLLGRRDYTAAELTTRLAARGYPDEAITEELRHLRASGAQDDARAAAAHVRTATRIKGRGRLRIERELLARGVSRDIVRALVAEMPADDDAAAIARVLERRRVPARLDPAARRRVFQHLLRRGFPADAIAKALRSRSDDDDDDGV